jgi:hypothetical protein
MGLAMREISFHWKAEWITPRLVTSIGRLVLEWSGIDHEVTRMCQGFWLRKYGDQGIPRSFDRRSVELKGYAAELYANEPDEYRVFSWYLQRLRTINGKRDDIVHGMPGKVTKGGREFEGLMVPFPSRPTKFIPMAIQDIEQVLEELRSLHIETGQVAYAIYIAAQVASLREIPNPPTLGGLLPSTTGPRSPMLPRWHPPPPTFQA